MVKVVFVCTGNTCRSPMAESIMKAKLKAMNVDGISVSSCGLSVFGGTSTERKALKALKGLGITCRARKAKRFTDKIQASADYIVTMTSDQKNRIISNKVYTLAELSNGGEVPDPYGQSQEVYDKTAFMLNLMIENFVQNLVGNIRSLQSDNR